MNLDDAMAANAADIRRATAPQLRRLLPVLEQAQRDLRATLTAWLRDNPGEQTFTAHRQRTILLQLERSIAAVRTKLRVSYVNDGIFMTDAANPLALQNLRTMVEAGSLEYEGAIRPLRIAEASILATQRRLAFATFQDAAERFTAALEEDIRQRVMAGLVSGESVDDMTNRLLRSSGMARYWRERGIAGIGEAFTTAVFSKARSHAEGVILTTVVDSMSAVQARAIADADRDDPGYFKMWDAANDGRVCAFCKSLDRVMVKPDEFFPAVGRLRARKHSPLHPRCRCGCVPMRREWMADRPTRLPEPAATRRRAS